MEKAHRGRRAPEPAGKVPALGWRSERCYLPGQHDISSVAYSYQALPTAPFPPLPNRDPLEED
jgi:hypothetical protein